MILEHNAIVNRSISGKVQCLARGEELTGVATIDPKTDVMPSANPGEEQVDAFRSSVDNHLESVQGLPNLRRGLTMRHPIFGKLNAHGWHCMFGLHLEIHLKQAEAAVELAS